MALEFGKYHPIDINNEAYVANPQSVFKWLRENAPVSWHPDYEGWIVVKAVDYDLTKDDELFVKAGLRTALQKLNKTNIHIEKYEEALNHFRELLQVTLNKERHHAIRKLLAPFFSNNALLRQVTKPIIEDALQMMFALIETRTIEKKPIDWQLEFTIPFTGILVNKTLGLSQNDCLRFYEISKEILDIFTVIESEKKLSEKANAMLELKSIYVPLIEQRRKHLIEGEILSELIKLRIEGKLITDDELITNIILLVTNIYLTVVGILSNILNVLARNPNAIIQIRNDNRLLPNAIREAIRYDGLGLFVSRVAKRDIELRGQKIMAGDQVFFFNASANWDEDIFDSPEVFNIHRNLKRNYSFGVSNSKFSCIAINFIDMVCHSVFHRLINDFESFSVELELLAVQSYIFKQTKRQLIKFELKKKDE